MDFSLIERFELVSGKLYQAVAADDTEAISVLDGEIRQVWDEIFDAIPSNPDDTHTLIEFLLSHMDSGIEIGLSNRKCSQKILSLVKLLMDQIPENSSGNTSANKIGL